MGISANQRWLRAVLLFGILYAVVGITFGALANPSTSNQMRFTWRLAAWLASAAAFAAHIWYEHSRLRNSPPTSALHVSVAVAIGAFVLAVAANVHELWTASNYRTSLALALVAWPALTAVPAFVVALAAAAVLKRTRRSL